MQFKTWSQTRLADYDQCPLAAKLKHLDKLCPLCFKGRIDGGYDEPAVCRACGEEIPTPPAMARGTEIGMTLEHYVTGAAAKPHAEIKNKAVLSLAKTLRAEYKKKRVIVEKLWYLDRNWRFLPDTGRWNPASWLIVKLDVFHEVTAKDGIIHDWKTGGVNKRTGEPYPNKKYAEQLQIYSVAGLCARPEMETVTSDLVFVDATNNPMAERGVLHRKDLEKTTKALTKRVLPLLNDTTFAPRANEKCTYCPYQKGKGGPCPY